ncbi:MAG: hypothetical protein ACM3H8_10345, partial [Sphingobacteriales bacterium]
MHIPQKGNCFVLINSVTFIFNPHHQLLLHFSLLKINLTRVDVKLFLICCLPLISFGQAKTKPVLNASIDGNLNRTEWLRSKDMGFYNFDFGRCYSRVSGDSLLMAFDIITDNTNDPSADFLQLYFDTNHDGLLGEGDLVMEANT